MSRYGQRPSVDDEPIVIDGEMCAKTLEHRGYPRMGQFVRELWKTRLEKLARQQQLEREFEAVLSRLHQYEPPQERVESLVRWTGD